MMMGREVRRVPASWEHPKDAKGRYVPLRDGYGSDLRAWNEAAEKWSRGEFPDYAGEEDRMLSFEEWEGPCPDASEYMPDWPNSERTHIMMYEDTTEGTPISPAFEAAEELAKWLADTGASAFGGMTASYEAWLSTINRGFAPSMVISAKGVMHSGVEAIGR
jgi:hypothetical protein